MNNKIINPATGRSVNRYGPIGQQVLKNRRTQRGGSKKRSPRRNSRRKSQRRKSRSKIGGGSNQTGNSWIAAVAKARKQLDIKGFQAVRKGTPLYKRAKQIQSGGGCRALRWRCMVGCSKKTKQKLADCVALEDNEPAQKPARRGGATVRGGVDVFEYHKRRGRYQR
jgi:hypothetical protein